MDRAVLKKGNKIFSDVLVSLDQLNDPDTNGFDTG